MNDKLIKVQQELKAPKSNRNTFGNYNYRSAEDILEAVKPLVHAEGLTLTISDEVVNIGNANYIKATVTLMDADEKRLWVSAYAREAETKKGMDDAQITGAASSYARKYALSGMFAIDDTKDADSQDNRPQPAKKAPVALPKPTDAVTQSQKAQLLNMMKGLGMDKDAMELAIHSILDKPTVDTQADYEKVIAEL